MKPKASLVCPLCGQANQCMSEAPNISDCWCFGVTISKQILARVPAELVDKGCLCPGCATAVTVPAEPGDPSVGSD